MSEWSVDCLRPVFWLHVYHWRRCGGECCWGAGDLFYICCGGVLRPRPAARHVVWAAAAAVAALGATCRRRDPAWNGAVGRARLHLIPRCRAGGGSDSGSCKPAGSVAVPLRSLGIAKHGSPAGLATCVACRPVWVMRQTAAPCDIPARCNGRGRRPLRASRRYLPRCAYQTRTGGLLPDKRIGWPMPSAVRSSVQGNIPLMSGLLRSVCGMLCGVKLFPISCWGQSGFLYLLVVFIFQKDPACRKHSLSPHVGSDFICFLSLFKINVFVILMSSADRIIARVPSISLISDMLH